jgi:hypothetical protein
MYLLHCHLCHPHPHTTCSGRCCYGHCCSRSCCRHVVGAAVGVVVVVVVAVVVAIWMFLPFSVCLGDAASAEPHRYLFSNLAHQTSTRGSVAKRVVVNAIATATGHVFESVKKQSFFYSPVN